MKERFKKIRSENGLTQQAFADKLELSRNFIAQIETGVKIPSERTVKDICRQFGYSEKWLLTGEGDPKENILPLDTVQAAVEFASQRKNKPVPKLLAAMAEMYMEMDEVDRETTDKLLKQLLEKMK